VGYINVRKQLFLYEYRLVALLLDGTGECRQLARPIYYGVSS